MHSPKTVTVTGITLGGADGGNYQANSTATTTANITPRFVTVTADAQFKTVGQPDPTLNSTVTSGTVVAGDSSTGALTRASGELEGTYAISESYWYGPLSFGPITTWVTPGANLTITAAMPI